MHQIVNFVYLARESLPFIRIYRSRVGLNKRRGPQYQFWQKLLTEIPEIGELGGKLQKRIWHYFFANRITTQWFATLHQVKPDTRELYAGYYLAAATPIADHMVDELNYTYEDICTILQKPSIDPLQKALFSLRIKANEFNSDPELFDKYLDLTLRAQAESVLQNTHTNGSSVLHNITWSKGGYALLLYRTALQTPISQQEKKAVFQLGGLMQLHNDLFDLYRDLQESIQTIPTTCRDISLLRAQFTEETNQTIQLFDQTPTHPIARKKFYLLMMLALNTGSICLDQYEQLQNKSGGIFNANAYSRNELICDMDRPYNIWKNILLTLNWKNNSDRH